MHANVNRPMKPLAPSSHLSTQQAARLCSVNRRTILCWVKDGLLPAHQTGGGHNRVLFADLLGFMHSRGMPLPEGVEPAGPRVAIVDDDVEFVTALSRFVLQARPEAELQVAHDGFGGGMLVATFKPQLVFLDVVMPGIDGVEVCRRLRAQPALRQTKIIVVSGHLTDARRQELSSLGADLALAKPIHQQQLVAALDEHLPVRPQALRPRS
jgi:excisionase family DNA binding protein